MEHAQSSTTSQPGSPAQGLAELLKYPLLSAISERRTRRICQGTSVNAGAVSHTSTNPPGPLTELEEAILIVSTGLAGFSLHDVPLKHPDGEPVVATTQMGIPARAASSADNAQATHFFLINDEGTWLLQQKRGREAVAWLREFPPNREEWTEEHWIAAAAGVKRRIYPERMDFPRRWPYYFTWNKIISNRPGTSVFMPVVDTTRQMINVLFIMISEPDGQRPLAIRLGDHDEQLVDHLARGIHHGHKHAGSGPVRNDLVPGEVVWPAAREIHPLGVDPPLDAGRGRDPMLLGPLLPIRRKLAQPRHRLAAPLLLEQPGAFVVDQEKMRGLRVVGAARGPRGDAHLRGRHHRLAIGVLERNVVQAETGKPGGNDENRLFELGERAGGVRAGVRNGARVDRGPLADSPGAPLRDCRKQRILEQFCEPLRGRPGLARRRLSVLHGTTPP